MKPTPANSSANPPDVCIYFEAHQPNRLKAYSFFDIGVDPFYEDDGLNRRILDKVSEKCYLPANAMFRELAEQHAGAFKIALGISGVLIEQLEHHRPDVLRSFVDLHATGCVELLAETYYHSLCFRASGAEFERQVRLHQQKLKDVFGAEPTVFRHTELTYFNEIAAFVEGLGFKGMLAEGVERILRGRSPNHLYHSPNVERLRTLTRNCRLSDDIAFRFADTKWSEYPLGPETFARWLAAENGDVVNLFLDYETIGEHQWEDSGIFEFWRSLPAAAIEAGCEFVTPGEALRRYQSAGVYDCHEITTWADASKDLSPWKSNAMQLEAKRKILDIEKEVHLHSDPELVHQWSKMQTSDHLYYMSTKGGDDGAVHEYFRPYPSAYDAYLYYMNALSDLQIRVRRRNERHLRTPFRYRGRRWDLEMGRPISRESDSSDSES